MAAAMIAGTGTQQQTMASTWPGRMPIALKMPRSWTLSRVVISTVLSTPSPAAIATISASNPIRALAMMKNCPPPCWPNAAHGLELPSSLLKLAMYAPADVPGFSPTFHWFRFASVAVPGRVDALPRGWAAWTG